MPSISSNSPIPNHDPIPALLPRGRGHQFVVYGDSCSGIPGAVNEEPTAAVNAVVARIEPAPEFICFLGDEIRGLTTNEEQLRAQWRHWFDIEMAWLDRSRIPLYNVPANHTTYDAMSERVYAEVMRHLPTNGPADQQRLSYVIRYDDLVMIFVNTMWTGLGEGRVETDWLDKTLAAHADAHYKLVLGHHPVFTINGFGGEYQREIEHANGRQFWHVLRRHGVLAYMCSHMLAFDTQIHDGILQIMTAGAGTKHRMPEESEYLHAVQVALDETGLHYQVLDPNGAVRERLVWPPVLTPSNTWAAVDARSTSPDAETFTVWECSGVCPLSSGESQTFLSFWNDDVWIPALWIGLIGPEMRVSMLLAPQVGRSPGLWRGPALEPGKPFSIQIGIHNDLGPGGMLWRWNDTDSWESMTGIAAWGGERLPPTSEIGIGHNKGGPEDQPFRGNHLRIVTANTRD